MGREQSLTLSVVISSGSGTGTFANAWDIVRWLRVVPIAETDSYDITIKDAAGRIMLKRTGNVGTFSERLEISLGIMRTILIENTTQDGSYTVVLDMH